MLNENRFLGTFRGHNTRTTTTNWRTSASIPIFLATFNWSSMIAFKGQTTITIFLSALVGKKFGRIHSGKYAKYLAYEIIALIYLTPTGRQFV